jgi:hypothetical protein
MTRPTKDALDAQASRPRHDRLRSLLFSGAALGTTLLALGGAIEPKLPPFQGE